jgi:DNA-binding CsgD family transcriptional regulator
MSGWDGVSAQALSDTIGAIYDCALDPQRWPDTCRKIAELCGSTDLRHAQNDQLFVHVCRVLAISDALDIRALRSEMLERTLDGLVTARDGRVVYMNAAAERQVRTGNSIRIVNNRVCPADSATRAALSKAIDEAARDDIDKDVSEYSLAIPDVDGGPGYVATLLPVDRGQRRDIIAPFAASVAVFTQDPVQAPLMPGEAFARLYGLTGGELRVVLALAQGLGAKEAADTLGIGEPTVRTHLQRIFSKTDTARQADLVRLLQNSTPPIRIPQRPEQNDRKATQRHSKSGHSVNRPNGAAAAVDV